MKDVYEILKSHGVELEEEKKKAFEKDFFDNYKTTAEVDKLQKKVQSLEEEKTSMQTKFDETLKEREDDLTQAQEALKAAKGNSEDIEKVQKQLADAEEKHKKAQKELKDEMKAQEKAFLIKEKISGYKFTSKAAEEHFLQKVQEADLKVVDGKLLGLDDFVEHYKSNDEGAFVKEDEGEPDNAEPKPKFGGKVNGKADDAEEPEDEDEEVADVW